MASWLGAIMDPLKSAGEMAKELVDIRDTVKFGNAVVELQTQILAAQQAAFSAQERETAMAEEIRDLKTRVADLETWDAEKQRYELTDFGSGTFAYLLKPNMSSGEPEHRLCAACYQKGHKSILQFRHQTATRQDKYACPVCKTDVLLGEYSEPQVIQTRRPGRSWTDR